MSLFFLLIFFYLFQYLVSLYLKLSEITVTKKKKLSSGGVNEIHFRFVTVCLTHPSVLEGRVRRFKSL